jgi:hypothetical protein
MILIIEMEDVLIGRIVYLLVTILSKFSKIFIFCIFVFDDDLYYFMFISTMKSTLFIVAILFS